VEPSDAITAASDAHRRHDWSAAWEAAVSARAVEGQAEADRLDIAADAAWWLGRLDDCIHARERAYVLYDEAGNHRRAGLCAIWLYEHYCFRAQPSIAGGWLRRARQLLGDDTESIECGALLLREAEQSHGVGDLDRASTLAEHALELSRKLRSPDLEAQALQTLGRIRIDQGEPTRGLELLDAAMLFALEDRVGPYATGKIYCSLISACEELGDMARAAEWVDATARWSQRHPLAVFPGLCRVHHATALAWRGAWTEAEREAARACQELAGLNRPNAAAAWEEIGDIRRRLGDLDGAEAAFSRAEELCGQPRAGLALLRLAQDRIAAAAAIMARALDGENWNRLARARLLAAYVQIAIAAHDLDTAAAALDELDTIAHNYRSPILAAHAATARGRLQLATGDPAAAGTLGTAVKQWIDLGVPYETATAWMLLGQAHRAAGDHTSQARAFATAAAIFDQLGALLDARHLKRLTGEQALPGGLTRREAEVLGLIATGKTNREIAAALHLSEKTVSRHLTNIFTKISVNTRAAATAFAYEHGLTRTQL